MSKVVAFIHVSLDGVMQAPGRPDEDRRGGFEHGGWATAYDGMQQAGQSGEFSGGLLLGRRTYEDFYSVWPQRKGSPFSAILDNMQKHVASRTLREPLPWMNSTLLKGDAVDAVAELKKEPGNDLLVLGSGTLLKSLMRRALVDRLILLTNPVVLGTGSRLFDDGGTFTPMRVAGSRTTPRGVVITTYEPAGDAVAGAA